MYHHYAKQQYTLRKRKTAFLKTKFYDLVLHLAKWMLCSADSINGFINNLKNVFWGSIFNKGAHIIISLEFK